MLCNDIISIREEICYIKHNFTNINNLDMEMIIRISLCSVLRDMFIKFSPLLNLKNLINTKSMYLIKEELIKGSIFNKVRYLKESDIIIDVDVDIRNYYLKLKLLRSDERCMKR